MVEFFRLMPRLVALFAVVTFGCASMMPHHAGAATENRPQVHMAQGVDCMDHALHAAISVMMPESGAVPAEEAPACCTASACAFDMSATGMIVTAWLDRSLQAAVDPLQHVAMAAPVPLQRPPRAI